MIFEYILYDTRDHVAKITLNRPKTYNGYHEHMVTESRRGDRPRAPGR